MSRIDTTGLHLNALLYRQVHASESVCGHRFDYRGTCVGIIIGPGVEHAFILESADGVTGDWLRLDDVTIESIL